MGRTRSPKNGTRRQHDVPLRPWTVLAQDPGILGPGGRALTTTVMVPAERLERGPKGHRVHVIDYDGSTDVYYRSHESPDDDRYDRVTDVEKLVRDPFFHQQNVYAIVMSTLQLFEFSLGRRVSWGFEAPSHQIKVAPHAYRDSNAAYSRESESLTFGDFPDERGRTTFTCLSHDIVVHEATHAALDGLRPHYLRPSSIDQGGFHEGFADVVALLSVFRNTEVVEHALAPLCSRGGRVNVELLDAKHLAGTALSRLAEQMGASMSGVPTDSLRESLKIRPNTKNYTSARFEEEHDRGELLVAMVLRAFLRIWLRRIEPLRHEGLETLSRSVVAEEGSKAAEHLARIAIRALDYLPPVHVSYGDYLSALLTADAQLVPDDSTFDYRSCLRDSFADHGVKPSSRSRIDGLWDRPKTRAFDLVGTHLEAMQRDPIEVFRFVWENRRALELHPDAFTRVTSVRPVTRVSNDQVVLRETVVEYVQTLKVRASELRKHRIRAPSGMPRDCLVTLDGGGTLVFDEFGRLKFHIGTGVAKEAQNERLQSLWDRDYFSDERASASARIAALHRDRVLRPLARPDERW